MEVYLKKQREKKNLIIFHLESVSSYILDNNRDCFPNLFSLTENMDEYKNYYSSATSTYMVIADLFFSGDVTFERSEYLENIFDIVPKNQSLWAKLEGEGYSTANFMLGYQPQYYEDGYNLGKKISANSLTWVGDDIHSFSEKFLHIIQDENKPFAIFVEDDASHISYNGERLEKGKFVGEDWYKERYCTIDKSIGVVVDILKENGRLDDVMFVIYGDHGEEFWFHGMYGGYTHAIEPFLSLTHCPLFIGTPRTKGVVREELLSTYSLSEEILYMLGLSDMSPNYEYVCFRNLFANQKKMVDVFNKAFGVTNGKYTLIASKEGLRMYANRIDPMCCLNLLDFFVYRKKDLKFNRLYLLNQSTHFEKFFSAEEVENIIAQFGLLHSYLEDYLAKVGPISTKISIVKIYNKGKLRVKLKPYAVLLAVWKAIKKNEPVEKFVKSVLRKE